MSTETDVLDDLKAWLRLADGPDDRMQIGARTVRAAAAEILRLRAAVAELRAAPGGPIPEAALLAYCEGRDTDA
jgi:hypothetical protein